MAAFKIILVTGGVKSGKSRYALARAHEVNGKRIFLATAEASDEVMAKKIQRHRQDRGDTFQTIEVPLYLGKAIKDIETLPDVIVIDCLTIWINNLFHYFKEDQAKVETEINQFIDTVEECSSTIIVVTNETGSGIIPDNTLARDFIGELGVLNQKVGEMSDELILMVSGVPQWIKGPPVDKQQLNDEFKFESRMSKSETNPKS